MSGKSKIEWTDATLNPVTGCTKVSPGCDHCYAERMHERFNGPGSFAAVALHPGRLDAPLRWRKPRRVFVNSMSDLFHKDVPDEFIARAWAVMAVTPQHTYQVLTKRHARMRSLLTSPRWAETLATTGAWPNDLDPEAPLPNVWLGVSVEDQARADLRIPALMEIPAAVRFLSCEPLLGEVHLCNCYPYGASFANYEGPQEHCWIHGRGAIHWVIVGGESGPGARAMHLPWAQSLRDQCTAAGVPFFFKQWGEWAPTKTLSVGIVDDPRECQAELVVDGKYPQMQWRRIMRRVGKKAAGRLLDGRTWDEYPEGAA